MKCPIKVLIWGPLEQFFPLQKVPDDVYLFQPRGLGGGSKQRSLNRFIDLNKVDIYLIQETVTSKTKAWEFFC